MQVGDGVAGGLEGLRRKRLPRRRDRIDTGRVVDEVGIEARFLNLRRRKVARELVDDRADHLHMRQFLGAYIVLRNVPNREICGQARPLRCAGTQYGKL